MSEKRILIMEGNPRDRRERAAQMGVRSSSEIYAEAIRAHFADIPIDILYGADADANGLGNRQWGDYAGFVVGGSALHAYDRDYGVTNQIALLWQAAEAGVPILGSCWGLQIAVVAAGGEVTHSPKGREVGIARKIMVHPEGHGHPMLRRRPPVFDAPCIHYDEVARLPNNATVLASNAHSPVQAAIIPIGNSEVWGVQYHPEFDLRHLADLYRLYAEDMVNQAFFADTVALDRQEAAMRHLADHPDDAGVAWQLGVDDDITNDAHRRAEIIAWIETKVCGGR